MEGRIRLWGMASGTGGELSTEPKLGVGADAIWWSFPVSSLVSMLLSLAYYRWGGWRRARMMSPPAHAGELATPAEVPACPPSPVADADAGADVDAQPGRS